MKKFSRTIIMIAFMACVTAAHARDDKLLLPIQDALNSPEAVKVLIA